MLQTQTKPAVVVGYSFINLSDIQKQIDFSNDKEVSKLKKEIILKGQGSAVVIRDDIKSDVTAFLVSQIYDISTEFMIFVQKEEICVKIFDHQMLDVLRSFEFNSSIWNKVIELQDKRYLKIKETKNELEELNIDFNKIWQQTNNKNIVQNTIYFLENLFNILQPSKKIVFFGEIPCLPVATAIYFSRPYSQKIIFKNNLGVEVELF